MTDDEIVDRARDILARRLRQAETVRVTPQGWLDVQLGASA